MANGALRLPGVYLQDRRERPSPVLSTGVPVFVGLVSSETYGPLLLRQKASFPGDARRHLDEAISGFFDNGGDHCYVVGVHAAVLDTEGKILDPAAATALIESFSLLASLTDVDLVAVPDAVVLNDAEGNRDELAACRVQRALVRHCTEHGDRIALLDSLWGADAAAVVQRQLPLLALPSADAKNAALYHPWIRTIATGERFVPPSGHVAGIIARADALSGVFRAPANMTIEDAIDIDAELDIESLSMLNDAGVNCLRVFPARGIRVWGARTLSNDPDWRYLNVRRLVLTVLRWIDLNMTWASFEPNVPALWARIQRELTVYLTRLWRAGALQGERLEEAFFIRCDEEINPPQVRENGQVVTEIGLAPTVPAEFIVVSIRHRAGTTELI